MVSETKLEAEKEDLKEETPNDQIIIKHQEVVEEAKIEEAVASTEVLETPAAENIEEKDNAEGIVRNDRKR